MENINIQVNVVKFLVNLVGNYYFMMPAYQIYVKEDCELYAQQIQVCDIPWIKGLSKLYLGV